MFSASRKKLLKIAALIVTALVLASVATIVVFKRQLSPERLTPLFKAYTTAKLNAKVEAARVELDISAAYPFFTLCVDSLNLLSADMLALSEQERAMLPSGVDTLASADRVEVFVKLPLWFGGTISLLRVKIDNLHIRPVKLSEGLANYHLRRQTVDEDANIEFDSLRLCGGCRIDYLDVSQSDSVVYVLPDTVMSENEIESIVSQLIAKLYMRRMLHSAKNDKYHDNE